MERRTYWLNILKYLTAIILPFILAVGIGTYIGIPDKILTPTCQLLVMLFGYRVAFQNSIKDIQEAGKSDWMVVPKTLSEKIKIFIIFSGSVFLVILLSFLIKPK